MSSFFGLVVTIILGAALICAWLDLFKAIGHAIWYFRVPITIAAVIYFGAMAVDFLFGTQIFFTWFGWAPKFLMH